MAGNKSRPPKKQASLMDEIVFEGRHHGYGAYKLRKHQHSYVKKGALCGLLIFIVLLSIPAIIKHVRHHDDAIEISVPVTTSETRLSAAPKLPEPPSDLAGNDPAAPLSSSASSKGTSKKPAKDTIAEKLQKDTLDISKDTSLAVDTAGPERMPMFPGGNALIADFIKTHLQYPWAEKESGIQGVAEVTFTVNEDGTLEDIETTGQVSIGINHEAERLINIMPPWYPAKHLDKPVKTRAKISIEFKLPKG